MKKPIILKHCFNSSRPLVIMKYNGGLGNQMFQHAAGITLAQKLGCEVEFDMGFFKRRYARAYQMGIFGIELHASKDFRTELYWRTRRLLKLKKVFGLDIYSEDMFCYDKRFEDIKENAFIEGFFQSPKYFDEWLVRKTFVFKDPPIGLNAQIANLIATTNSVSLHIRRGDYVSKARNQKTFNELKPDYYNEACKIMSQNVADPRYFVFSDSISWAKANVPLENAYYIEHNTGSNSWEDMRLMSLCKYNIIANSSFSWWGAYLNSYLRKLVIAPKKWFVDPELCSDDICPEEWILL